MTDRPPFAVREVLAKHPDIVRRFVKATAR